MITFSARSFCTSEAAAEVEKYPGLELCEGGCINPRLNPKP